MRALRLLMLGTLLVLPIPLAGCVTTGGASIKDIAAHVCKDWRGQRWASTDHKITIADAKGNNARRVPWCGAK